MTRRRSSFKKKRQRMRSTSPLPRRNGATRLEHRVPSSTSRLSTSLLPSRKSSNAKTRPHQVDLPVELSRNECALRSGNCALSTENHSKRVQDRRRAAPWRHQQFPADRAALAIAIAQAAANLVRCIDCTASQMIFFDSHFFALRFAVGSQCPKI